MRYTDYRKEEDERFLWVMSTWGKGRYRFEMSKRCIRHMDNQTSQHHNKALQTTNDKPIQRQNNYIPIPITHCTFSARRHPYHRMIANIANKQISLDNQKGFCIFIHVSHHQTGYSTEITRADGLQARGIFSPERLFFASCLARTSHGDFLNL
jgi:hypothetical protein